MALGVSIVLKDVSDISTAISSQLSLVSIYQFPCQACYCRIYGVWSIVLKEISDISMAILSQFFTSFIYQLPCQACHDRTHYRSNYIDP